MSEILNYEVNGKKYLLMDFKHHLPMEPIYTGGYTHEEKEGTILDGIKGASVLAILLILAFIVPTALRSQNVRVITTGHAYVTDDITLAQARKMAIQDAQVNALRYAGIPENVICRQTQATEQNLSPAMFNTHYADNTTTDISGTILHDTITDDTTYIDAEHRIVCQVTIRAMVALQKPEVNTSATGNDAQPAIGYYHAGTTSGDCDNGYGTCNYYNGDTYTGYWKNGKRNGYGTYRWKDGLTYKCYWLDGIRQEGVPAQDQYKAPDTTTKGNIETQNYSAPQSKLDIDAKNFANQVEEQKQKMQ